MGVEFNTPQTSSLTQDVQMVLLSLIRSDGVLQKVVRDKI